MIVAYGEGDPPELLVEDEVLDELIEQNQLRVQEVQLGGWSDARSDVHAIDPPEHPQAKRMFVWFEANAQSTLEDFMEHAEEWSSVGTLIMTARFHNAKTYTRWAFRHDVPVISGFKTSDVFADRALHDPEAWAQIAALARDLSVLTQGRPVVLENEGTVAAFLTKGGDSVDYDAMLAAIAAQDWPEIWFWYSPLGRSEPVQTISYDIARAVVDGIPTARLIEPNSSGYTASNRTDTSKDNVERTLGLDENPLSIIYVNDERIAFWPMQYLSEAISLAAGDDVIIYPGLGDIHRANEARQQLDAGQGHYFMEVSD